MKTWESLTVVSQAVWYMFLVCWMDWTPHTHRTALSYAVKETRVCGHSPSSCCWAASRAVLRSDRRRSARPPSPHTALSAAPSDACTPRLRTPPDSRSGPSSWCGPWTWSWLYSWWSSCRPVQSPAADAATFLQNTHTHTLNNPRHVFKYALIWIVRNLMHSHWYPIQISFWQER